MQAVIEIPAAYADKRSAQTISTHIQITRCTRDGTSTRIQRAQIKLRNSRRAITHRYL